MIKSYNISNIKKKIPITSISNLTNFLNCSNNSSESYPTTPHHKHGTNDIDYD